MAKQQEENRVPADLKELEGLEAVEVFHVLSPVCEPQILRQIITWTKTEAHTHETPKLFHDMQLLVLFPAAGMGEAL